VRACNVSDVLLDQRSALPGNIRSRVEELATLVSQLASIRGIALYGYEREGIFASKAFSGEYAEKTFLAVKKYLELIEKSLRDAGVLK